MGEEPCRRATTLLHGSVAGTKKTLSLSLPLSLTLSLSHLLYNTYTAINPPMISHSFFHSFTYSLIHPFFSYYQQQQMMSPLAIFQVFCAMLWLLDEYWSYTMWSLVSIVIFQVTTPSLSPSLPSSTLSIHSILMYTTLPQSVVLRRSFLY